MPRFLGAIVAASLGVVATAADRPNIVWVVVDDMSANLRTRLAEWEEKTDDQGRKPEPMAAYDADMAVYLNGMTGPKADELRRNIDLNKTWAKEGK
jgi:hypothetical protein